METQAQEMTRAEIVKIILAIKVQCQDALPYRNENEFDIIVDMWFDILKDYPPPVVWLAVKNALKNTAYQRQNWIGAINKEIEKMRTAYEKTDNEYWNELADILPLVESLSYKFKYTAIEENGKEQGENALESVRQLYNGLSDEIRLYCGSVSRLVDISHLDREHLDFEKGRFLKAMPQIKQMAKIRAQVGEIAGVLQGKDLFLIE